MKIDENVLRVLSTLEITGTAARITAGKLDRKLYQKANAVLEELGGKWDKKAKAHLFPGDPTDAIDAVINAGEITTAREQGFFATPAWLAAQLVASAGVQPGTRVLEPSAGEGAIARAAHAAGAVVQCIEFDAKRCTKLEDLGFHVQHADFLTVPFAPRFDAVCMNPPFSRQQDIDHVRHAFEFLRPGGRLAAIMSASTALRENGKTVAFRALVDAHAGTIEALPDDAFVDAGTRVRTVVVTMTRGEE